MQEDHPLALRTPHDVPKVRRSRGGVSEAACPAPLKTGSDIARAINCGGGGQRVAEAKPSVKTQKLIFTAVQRHQYKK